MIEVQLDYILRLKFDLDFEADPAGPVFLWQCFSSTNPFLIDLHPFSIVFGCSERDVNERVALIGKINADLLSKDSLERRLC